MAEQSSIAELSIHPDKWVDAYGNHLYRYAFMRLRNRLEAEEAVQETFLAGINHLTQFRGESHQIGWLFGILKRKILDCMRARIERQHCLPEAQPMITGGCPDLECDWLYLIPDVDRENAIELHELWDVVRDCLTTLPPDQADAFTLAVMDQLDSEAAGEVLQITTSSFRVRLHRARLGLARCVSKKWGMGVR
jgi:RNA polymerase sigma factor (sigma-70 family)